MTEAKPHKTSYKNQKEICNIIISKIKNNYLKDMQQAYLIGSLASGSFGKYKKEYGGYSGSDVDIVALLKKIRKEWVYEGEFYNWHKRYYIGEINIENVTHPINLMVPLKRNFEDLWLLAKKLNWVVIKLK